MAAPFRSIDPRQIPDNAFKLVADDWTLITAGTLESFNTMTASWAVLGQLWNKEIAICFVRPSRYTYQFLERESIFTLSYFGPEYREALDICGTLSGRDGDKISKAGLTPLKLESGGVSFDEARIIMVCRKVYVEDLDPKKFLLPEIEKFYPSPDYHRMYFGEILNCWLK